MKILYAASLNKGSTCVSRKDALEALGNELFPFDFKAQVSAKWTEKLAFHWGVGPLIYTVSRNLYRAVGLYRPDILWIDKGMYVHPHTLRKIKRSFPRTVLVHLNPDDPYGLYQEGFSLFKKAIPYYDVHFVSRPQNVAEYRAAGAENVFEYDRSFDPAIHRPVTLVGEEAQKFSTPVGFIGSYAPARADVLAYLIDNGVPLAIYGDRWEKYPGFEKLRPHVKSTALYGTDYAKAISGMNIALHFLRKENRDDQDSRSFEIPACGSFMLAERSPKHMEIFAEDKEAVFFDTKEELLAKIRHYLAHPDERQAIARSGYARSHTSGYDHFNRMKGLMSIIHNPA